MNVMVNFWIGNYSICVIDADCFFMINVDEPEASDVAVTASNVRKDLTEWQEQHATLVLTNVKVK